MHFFFDFDVVEWNETMRLCEYFCSEIFLIYSSEEISTQNLPQQCFMK